MEYTIILQTVIALCALLGGLGFIVNMFIKPLRAGQADLKENIKETQAEIKATQADIKATQAKMEGDVQSIHTRLDKLYVLLSEKKNIV